MPSLTALTIDELQQGAMFLTEKQAGSDVGVTTTVAKPRSGVGEGLQPEWELWGDKWFCSNVSADIILTLARAGGELQQAHVGLDYSLCPGRWRWTRNAYSIHGLER